MKYWQKFGQSKPQPQKFNQFETYQSKGAKSKPIPKKKRKNNNFFFKIRVLK
jgi:hypothetical protein